MSEAWILRFQTQDCFTCAASSSQLLNQKTQVNQSESFTNFGFKTTIACLALTATLEYLSSLFCFAELALPSWLRPGLRHILYKEFDSSPPVIEVMIFIPTRPTIRWHMLNIPKRILVSTYMLIASAWKLIAFEYENNEGRENNNHTKRLNWSSFKETPYRNLDMSQQP